MKNLNFKLQLRKGRKTWLILAAAFLAFGGCRPGQAYERLIGQIQQDTILSTMERSGRAHFAVIPSELLDSALQQSRHYLFALDRLQLQKLNREQRAGVDSLQRRLRENFERWSRYRSDPSLYNIAAEIKRQLGRSDLSLENKLQFIGQRLEEAEIYYRAAKQNIRMPSPERSQLAVQKQILGLKLLSEELPDSIRQASLPEADRQVLLVKVEKATLLLKDYLAFCESLWFEHLDSLVQKGNRSILSINAPANPQ